MRNLSDVAHERRVLLAFGVTALYAALSLVSSGLAVFGGLFEQQMQPPGAPPLPPEIQDFMAAGLVLVLVFAVLSPFLFWLFVSGLMHLVTRFFGGSGPFSGTLAVVSVAQAPLVVYAALAIPLTGLQILLTPQDADSAVALAGGLVGLVSGLISLAAFVWFAVLVVIGSSFARRVGYGESAGSCAISCGGCLGLIIVVIVALVAIVAGASAPQ